MKKFMIYKEELIEVLSQNSTNQTVAVKYLVGYEAPFVVNRFELKPVPPEVRRAYQYMHDNAETLFPKKTSMFQGVRRVLMSFAN